jgi:hypothetical protein
MSYDLTRHHRENKKKKHLLPTIRCIPDLVWNEVKEILPKEKPPKTVGRPSVPYRTVLDGILYVLRTEGVSGKHCQKSMAQVLHAIGGFNNGLGWAYSRNYGSGY